MWIVDKILEAWDARVRIKVLVHEAFFTPDSQKIPHYFVKVVNLSPKKDITLTHIWVKDGNKKLNVINPNTPLPQRLSPSDIWETWFRKDSIEDHNNVFRNVCVMTSDSRIHKSTKNTSVPSAGFIARVRNRY